MEMHFGVAQRNTNIYFAQFSKKPSNNINSVTLVLDTMETMNLKIYVTNTAFSMCANHTDLNRDHQSITLRALTETFFHN